MGMQRWMVTMILRGVLLTTAIGSGWTQDEIDVRQLEKQYIELRLDTLYRSTAGFEFEGEEAYFPEDASRVAEIEDLCFQLLDLVAAHPAVFGKEPDMFANIHLIDTATLKNKAALQALIDEYEALLDNTDNPRLQAIAHYCLYVARDSLRYEYNDPDSPAGTRLGDQARRHLEQAARLDPKQFRIVKELFELKVRLGELEGEERLAQAQPILRLITKPNPNVPDWATYYHAYWRFEYRVALYLMSMGKFEEAERSLRRLIDTYAPKTFDRQKYYHFMFNYVYNNLAACFMQTNKLNLARQACEQALRLNPDNAPAHINLGLLAADSGDLRKALSHFKRGAAADPLRSDVHLHMGVCYQELGQRRAAVNEFQKVLQLDNRSMAAQEADRRLKELGVTPKVVVKPGQAPPKQQPPRRRPRRRLSDDLDSSQRPSAESQAQAERNRQSAYHPDTGPDTGPDTDPDTDPDAEINTDSAPATNPDPDSDSDAPSSRLREPGSAPPAP